MCMRKLRLGLLATAALLATPAAHAQAKPTLRLATTSALQETGLLAWLLPKFSVDTGIAVEVLAVDAKRAFELGKRCEADALLIDDRASEDFFVSQRHANERREVMYVEYLLGGPRSDPAQLGDAASAPGAAKAIAATKSSFVSRGDGSGAHEAEKRLWSAAGRVPETGAGAWYFSANAAAPGMLALAGAKQAYFVIDRPSWLSLRNHYGLIELASGGPIMQNPYGVLVVNDLKHKTARYALGKKLADWLTGAQGRPLIAQFKIADKPVYFVR